jgi:hypothetical protein
MKLPMAAAEKFVLTVQPELMFGYKSVVCVARGLSASIGTGPSIALPFIHSQERQPRLLGA